MKSLNGTISLPGDKSISHRAAMFSVIAQGESRITNLSNGGDVASTISCLSALGAHFQHDGTELITQGKGLHSLSGTDVVLDCGNSGTSLRLLTGLLSGQDVHNVSLIGDDSLSRRPHDRVINPLQKLGVDISGRDGSFTPVVINSSKPHSGEVAMTIASAQVKSALLLAGLYADGPVSVIEEKKTRDHTENMLNSMGVTVSSENVSSGNVITILPPTKPLSPLTAVIPGDPSSAAFFGVAACIIPGSDITMTDILLNPTRIAWVDALFSMGADITVEETGSVMGERVGTIHVRHAPLTATEISGDIIASLIDELPILSIAMAVATGTSRVRDAHELRVKESDRISVVVDHLTRAGIQVAEVEDGYDITGGMLNELDIQSDGDHRIAMSFSIANYCATGVLSEVDRAVVATSFPSFFNLFESLISS
ncbi:MAG TPA: 3-phosphoshikimate 1-carboxyvinyltransferase [Acidimicrobiia bacterium]|nr:3-phosphoshikimate 1-carboxyvinyltransferase [Acidimicrobiia bacterium]